jgi:hypothetical protein
MGLDVVGPNVGEPNAIDLDTVEPTAIEPDAGPKV